MYNMSSRTSATQNELDAIQGLLDLSNGVSAAAYSVPAAATSVPAAATSVPAAAKSVPAAAKSLPAAAKSVPVAAKSVPAAAKSVTLAANSVPVATTSKDVPDESTITKKKIKTVTASASDVKVEAVVKISVPAAKKTTSRRPVNIRNNQSKSSDACAGRTKRKLSPCRVTAGSSKFQHEDKKQTKNPPKRDVAATSSKYEKQIEPTELEMRMMKNELEDYYNNNKMIQLNKKLKRKIQEIEKEVELLKSDTTSVGRLSDHDDVVDYNDPKPSTSRSYRRRSNNNEASTSHESDQSGGTVDPDFGPVGPDGKIPIGDGHARVSPRVLAQIKIWNNVTFPKATRKLLEDVFGREILSTHCLTGKPSPAFPQKKARKGLDPKKVHDIVTTVAEKCMVIEGLVRSCITTKCADEYKMAKKARRNNRENISPGSETESD